MVEVYTLYWLSAKRDAEFNMGSFDSRDEANEQMPAAWDELRRQLGAGEPDWVSQGTMEVVKENLYEDGDELPEGGQ
jgi:hypothetical protein